MSRRESVGRLRAASQSESAEPTVKMVSCAVLPPRLPQGMAPPTGVGMADTFNFDEALNWQHNDPIQGVEPSRRKSFFRKVGLTTQRRRVCEEDDLPPFVMRQIPYDTWRKHYAKDKDGNYRGTHAPAEDCLLKPEDVQKWRLGDPITKADKWTRGSEALPVYAEVCAEGNAPDYHLGQQNSSHPSTNEPIMTRDDDRLATDFDASDIATQPSILMPSNSIREPSNDGSEPQYWKQTIADGKTAAEIIAEAEAKTKPKDGLETEVIQRHSDGHGWELTGSTTRGIS